VKSMITERDGFVVLGTMTRITPADENSETYGLIWKNFESYHNRIKPMSTDGAYYGVSFTTGEEGGFDYVAGMAVADVDASPQGLVLRHIPPARFAVFECPVQSIGDTYRAIFSEWLPSSPYTLSVSAPSFEQYPPEGEKESLVRIHIPIEAKEPLSH
jgi:predicted transcriptional regulator YdeE